MSQKKKTLPKILLIDEQMIFSLGVRTLIQKLGIMEVVGIADCIRDAKNILVSKQPDLIWVECSMYINCDSELIRQFEGANPTMKLVMVCKQEEGSETVLAIKHGALVCVSRGDSLQQMALALEKAAGGDFFVSRALQTPSIRKLKDDERGLSCHSLQHLSSRQLDVFMCLSEGMKRSEIASALGVSVKTVETHRLHIKRKLGLCSSAEIKQLAMDWQLMNAK